jgi:hypothetical protein
MESESFEIVGQLVGVLLQGLVAVAVMMLVEVLGDWL